MRTLRCPIAPASGVTPKRALSSPARTSTPRLVRRKLSTSRFSCSWTGASDQSLFPPETCLSFTFIHSLITRCSEPPTSGGRERWGFAKKIAEPSLKVERDTLVGTLNYNGAAVARATMAYKHAEMDKAVAMKTLTKLQSNLKIISSPQWTPEIARLIGYHLCDVNVKFAYTGDARLELFNHVNAPIADLPIKKILKNQASHICANITLPGGFVMHDYLKDKINRTPDMGGFTTEQILNTVSIPHASPSYTKGPAKLTDREIAFIKYKTDPELLRAQLPKELIANAEGEVLYEVVSTHGSGLGSYSRASQYIPCTLAATGEQLNFYVQAYCNNSSPITAGREVLGQPMNFAMPSLTTERDTVVAQLKTWNNQHTVAFGTIAYKHSRMSESEAAAMLSKPSVTLKIIPAAEGTGQDIAQLVKVKHSQVKVRSAWKGNARLELLSHVNAPLADLPVRSVQEGITIDVESMWLDGGEVIVDYLAGKGVAQ
jgi:acetoacetate decarboxylase